MSHPQAVVYPDSDGKPMTDSDENRLMMEYVEFALNGLYRNDPQVYVSVDLFIYFREGAPGARIAPDVFLVRGVEKKLRDNFKIWEEGVGPVVVFEFLWRWTRKRDLTYKPKRYATLGVNEYFVFDVKGLWLPEKLLVYKRTGEELVPVPDRTSDELGLELRIEGPWLRLVKEGRPLPTAKEERERADREQERADRLEAENARLRAMLEERG